MVDNAPVATGRKATEQDAVLTWVAAGRRVDFHSLRMVFGAWLAVSGAHPRVAMELMRHSDLKLTMKIYTDASQLPLVAGVAALPSFGVANSVSAPQENRPLKIANS